MEGPRFFELEFCAKVLRMFRRWRVRGFEEVGDRGQVHAGRGGLETDWLSSGTLLPVRNLSSP